MYRYRYVVMCTLAYLCHSRQLPHSEGGVSHIVVIEVACSIAGY